MSLNHTVAHLDPEQRAMLGALVSLWKKNPHGRFNYPMIADEMAAQNGGKSPCLDALRKNKIPLLQAGFIRDESVGFVITEQGMQAHHSNGTVRKH